jgi:hypothetical protein
VVRCRRVPRAGKLHGTSSTGSYLRDTPCRAPALCQTRIPSTTSAHTRPQAVVSDAAHRFTPRKGSGSGPAEHNSVRDHREKAQTTVTVGVTAQWAVRVGE